MLDILFGIVVVILNFRIENWISYKFFFCFMIRVGYGPILYLNQKETLLWNDGDVKIINMKFVSHSFPIKSLNKTSNVHDEFLKKNVRILWFVTWFEFHVEIWFSIDRFSGEMSNYIAISHQHLQTFWCFL